MCGITGIVHIDKSPIDEQLLHAMTASLRHRGPDDEGFFIASDVGLGHRRLAILDLSLAGHCPMPDHTQRCWITYNGEVYNYKELLPELQARGYQFRSNSDTEVVLYSYITYGADCLRRFNGMWGFAIWDAEKNQLFCARDRFGVKPFYYTWDGVHFRFASEIKALLVDPAQPRRANHARVMDYLFNSMVDHTPETMFEGIYQLPPGHFLVVGADGLRVERYYSIQPQVDLPHKYEEQIEGFRALFTDAIRLRLRSDVTVGTCLSGGLDSSAIVCMANQLLQQGDGQSLGSRQKTFTVGFQDPAIDERRYARAVVAQTNAQAHEIELSSSAIAQNLDLMLWHQDEPFASASGCAQWFVMQCAHNAGVTVLLDGQGGDETLAGYDPHLLPYLIDLLLAGQWSDSFWEATHNRYLFSLAAIQRPVSEILPTPVYNLLWQRSRTYFFPGLQCIEGGAPLRYPIAPPDFNGHSSRLNQTLYRDIVGARLPTLLHLEDRNSMAHSIESRTPFLDYRLVEYVFGLPIQQKRWHGETKVVMRRALQNVLPSAILQRRDKIGFAAPVLLLQEPALCELVEETLHSTTFRQRPYFNSQEAMVAWKEFQQGNHSLQRTIWQWLVVEHWLRVFQITT